MSAVFGVYKNTIKLRSGRYFDFVDPQPDQFTIEDITGGLSKICRFGGQVKKFYSVAEHSVICESVAMVDGQSVDVRRAVLLHDAAESFVGDVVKPLKIMLPEYSIIEDRIEAVIADKYHVDFNTNCTVIKEIDHAVLIAERRCLFDCDTVKWYGEDSVRRIDLAVRNLSPARAERAMLVAWQEVMT